MNEWNKRSTTKSYDDSPIVTFYQFKAPEEPENIKKETLDKIKVLKKGQEFIGSYVHSFSQTYKEKDGTTKTVKSNHLITTDEGKISLKGCKSLNEGLDGLKPGDRIKIVYLGKGQKPKNPMNKAPYLFDVFDAKPAAVADIEEVASEDSSDEEDMDEVTF